jgi:Tfp pilus assembly protein PilN
MRALEKYQWLSSCTGIELHILPDGSFSCRGCLISIQKDALSIDSKFEVEGDLRKVLKKIPADLPVSVSITGKNVLTKKTAKVEDMGPDKLLRLFPNIKPEQFYIQNFISGEFSFISIIRKEVLDEILLSFNKSDLNTLLLNLGPFATSHILGQLNVYGKAIRFDGHIINLSEKNVWENYKYEASAKSEFPLKIDIESIAEQYIVAYAAAFQLALYNKLNAVVVPVDSVYNKLSDFEQKQKFNFRLAVILGSFFVLLLLNFLLFSYYSSKNDLLLGQVSQSTASVESVRVAENNIANNEKLLKELGWYKGVRHAWLADQLGQSIPAGINLTEISINPLNTVESNRLRQEVYKTGTIHISGEANDLTSMNEWMYALKAKTWPRGVNLDSFAPSPENSKQHFAITIIY